MNVNYIVCDMCGSKINGEPEFSLIHKISHKDIKIEETSTVNYSKIDLCNKCGLKIIKSMRDYMEIYNPTMLERLVKQQEL